MAQVLGPPTPPSQGSLVIWWRAGSRVDIGNQVDELARVVDVQRMPEPRSPVLKIVNHVDELSGTCTRSRVTACTTPGTPGAYSPRSERPGWSSGRRPSGQRYFRARSAIGRSLMLAMRRRM